MKFRTRFFPIDLFGLVKTESPVGLHCADNDRQFKPLAADGPMTLE
jgi:hypothetical protein